MPNLLGIGKVPAPILASTDTAKGRRAMTHYRRIGFVLGSFAALLVACGNDAGSAKTEVLPNDGGDLGKAYFDLAAAMKAGDKERAGPLLDAYRCGPDAAP
jgi:hypothetical protein